MAFLLVVFSFMGTGVSLDEKIETDDSDAPALLFEHRRPTKLPKLAACIESREFKLRNIIRRFDELPELVRLAKFAGVDERRLHYELMTTLFTQPPRPNHQCDWELRLQKRKNALARYRGKVLHCVFIHLPGVHYTIEIDLEASVVVHWEWQNA